MIQFTFEDILERLKNNLSKRLENSGILFYSANQRILEAVAEELAEQMRYNEYLTSEAKWSTAQNLSSIMAQVDFFGYVPHRKIGAVGELKVSTSRGFNGSWAFPINIPKFTQFSNGEIYFASSEGVTLSPSSNFVYIPIAQGIVKKEEFPTIAYDDIYLTKFSISIGGENIENNLIEVKVNGTLWKKVDYLEESNIYGGAVYTIKNNLDFSGISINFGDGVISDKIASGDLIEVTYLETEGEAGEVLKANNIAQVISTVRDQNNSIVKLYCTNEKIVTGGKEEEKIDTIKVKAPSSFRTGNILVTKKDYEAAILETGIPDKVIVWGEAEQNMDNNLPMGTFIPFSENLIYVSALTISEKTKEAFSLTEIQKDSIYNSLVNKKGLTDIIQFVTPKITYIDFFTIAYYDKSSSSADVIKTTVVDSLYNKYSIINLEREFKENLYFSQYYAFLNGLEGVSYHETDLRLHQIYPSEGTSGGGYLFSCNLGFRDIRKETVKIYIRTIDDTVDDSHPYSFNSPDGWFLIAEDNGTGNFISKEVPDYSGIPDFGDTFEVVTIDPIDKFDYSKGLLEGIVVSKGIPSGWNEYLQFKVEFQTGEIKVDVIPISRNQIFGVGSAIVEARGITIK